MDKKIIYTNSAQILFFVIITLVGVGVATAFYRKINGEVTW